MSSHILATVAACVAVTCVTFLIIDSAVFSSTDSEILHAENEVLTKLQKNHHKNTTLCWDVLSPPAIYYDNWTFHSNLKFHQ